MIFLRKTLLELSAETQDSVDAFYWSHGPCCAGCDWWRYWNSLAGECLRSAPVPGSERIAMLEMTSCSRPLEAGHVMTVRDHHCGEFKDTFDWNSLSLAHRRRIGAPVTVESTKPDDAI